MRQEKTNRRLVYRIRRIKTALASIAFLVSCTMLFVAERPASAPGLWVVAAVYLLTGLWLAIRFAPREDEPGDDTSPQPAGRNGNKQR